MIVASAMRRARLRFVGFVAHRLDDHLSREGALLCYEEATHPALCQEITNDEVGSVVVSRLFREPRLRDMDWNARERFGGKHAVLRCANGGVERHVRRPRFGGDLGTNRCSRVGHHRLGEPQLGGDLGERSPGHGRALERCEFVMGKGAPIA